MRHRHIIMTTQCTDIPVRNHCELNVFKYISTALERTTNNTRRTEHQLLFGEAFTKTPGLLESAESIND